MPELSKIRKNGVDYALKDTTARETAGKAVQTVNGTAPDENGNVQIAVSEPSPNTGYRIKGKNVVFFGDSICSGAGSTGGYASRIQEITGCVANNQGVSGATIANAGTSTHKIVNMVREFTGDADMIVIEGGANDCAGGIALGEITATYTDELDETTFCGALESIIQTLLTNFPAAQLFGVITHRDVTDAYTNANGVTKKEFRDKAAAIYEKYAVPYYDAFTASGFVTAYTTATGLPAFGKALADMYTYDGDKCHPNEAGYAKYYVPQIINLLEGHCPVGEYDDDTGGDTGGDADGDTGGDTGGTPETIQADMSIVGFTRAAGTFSTAETGRRTDYISMDGVQSISIKVGGYDSACALAFFDSSKAFIADISVQNSQDDSAQYGWIEKTIDVTAAEYAQAQYFIISSYHNSVADHVYNGDNTFDCDSASYVRA